MTMLDIIEVYNCINHTEGLYGMLQDYVLDERLDRELLNEVLLAECGATECIYNTTETFKTFTDSFFKKYYDNIKRLLDTMEYNYDPLVTYKGNYTDYTNIDQIMTGTQSDKGTNSYTEGTSDNESGSESHQDTDNKTVTNTVSAFNSDAYQPDNQSVTADNQSGSSSHENNSNGSKNHSGSDSNDMSKKDVLDWDEVDKHVEEGYKDVIISDIIEKERKLAEFNIYNWIANKYRQELFLLVY